MYTRAMEQRERRRGVVVLYTPSRDRLVTHTNNLRKVDVRKLKHSLKWDLPFVDGRRRWAKVCEGVGEYNIIYSIKNGMESPSLRFKETSASNG